MHCKPRPSEGLQRIIEADHWRGGGPRDGGGAWERKVEPEGRRQDLRSDRTFRGREKTRKAGLRRGKGLEKTRTKEA